jgi:hypothetical protein
VLGVDLLGQVTHLRRPEIDRVVDVADVEPFDRVPVERVVAADRLPVRSDVAEAVITGLLGLERLDRAELAGLGLLELGRRRLDQRSTSYGLFRFLGCGRRRRRCRRLLEAAVMLVRGRDDPLDLAGELGVDLARPNELEPLGEKVRNVVAEIALNAVLPDANIIAAGRRGIVLDLPLEAPELALATAVNDRMKADKKAGVTLALESLAELDLVPKIVNCVIGLGLYRRAVRIREALSCALEIG